MSREILDAFVAARAAIAAEQLDLEAAHKLVPVEPTITDEAKVARARGGIEAVGRAGCRACGHLLLDYAVDHEIARVAVEKAEQALFKAKQAAGFDAALAACQRALPGLRVAADSTALAVDAAGARFINAAAALEAEKDPDKRIALQASVDAALGAVDGARAARDQAQLLYADFLRELGPFAKGPGGRPL